MSIENRLRNLEAAVVDSRPTFDAFIATVVSGKRWTIAEWYHRLAATGDAAFARREAGMLIVALPDDDAEMMRLMRECPADYAPALPAGVVPEYPVGDDGK